MSDIERLQELKALADNNDILAGSMFGDTWNIDDDFQWLIEQVENIPSLQSYMLTLAKAVDYRMEEHRKLNAMINKLREALEFYSEEGSYDDGEIAREVLELE